MEPPVSEQSYRIALIPGDGIGHEVVPAAVGVLEKAGRRFGFSFEWAEFDWSSERYSKLGQMMPEDGVEQLRPFDGISSAPSATPASPITFLSGAC